MKMESGMMVAEGLWGDTHRLSRTNINNETFTPSFLLFMLSLSLSISFSRLILCSHTPSLFLFSHQNFYSVFGIN